MERKLEDSILKDLRVLSLSDKCNFFCFVFETFFSHRPVCVLLLSSLQPSLFFFGVVGRLSYTYVRRNIEFCLEKGHHQSETSTNKRFC